MTIDRRTFAAGVAAALAAPHAAGALALADNAPLTGIAFGSCAKQWEKQPIWNAIAAQRPELFLFLGDAIYGDWDGRDVFIPTVETLRRDWARLAAIPDFARFRETVPILATWDNHDYGKHDGGAEFTLKQESKAAFLDFFGEPADTPRRRREGIYDAVEIGPEGRRTQIILLDARSFKSPYLKDERTAEEKARLGIRGQYLPNADPGATLLGEDQWRWLEAQLRRPADLRLICSGVQVVADEKGMEEWGNFPAERRRLFDLIAETAANGVIFLSGNVHYSELSVTDEGPYLLHDFTASGLTHTNPNYARLRNRRRIDGPLTALNFGMVEIDWDASGGPTVTLRACDAAGASAFSRINALEALRV